MRHPTYADAASPLAAPGGSVPRRARVRWRSRDGGSPEAGAGTSAGRTRVLDLLRAAVRAAAELARTAMVIADLRPGSDEVATSVEKQRDCVVLLASGVLACAYSVLVCKRAIGSGLQQNLHDLLVGRASVAEDHRFQ